MSGFTSTVVAIVGLAVLMIVHEAGHFILARRAGLRVTKFSVGFGPTFFKIQPFDESGGADKDRPVDPEAAPPPQSYFWFTAFGDRIRFKLMKYDPARHGPTIYQVAMIPFLAYVQIAGMNPLEDVDPTDKGSYANAGLWSRVKTIAGGPLANYLFASVFFFIAFYGDGDIVVGTHLRLQRDDQDQILDDKPAKNAGLQDDDRILEINGVATKEWEDVPKLVGPNAGKTLHVLVERDGEKRTFDVVPDAGGKIGIQYTPGDVTKAKLSVGEAAVRAAEAPVVVVQRIVKMMNELVHGREKAKLGSTVAMVKEMKKAAQDGWAEFLMFLGSLSAYLAVFNLLPVPALDGGRLVFLGYEAVTRKRPNPTMEAQIHAIGLVMLLGLMIYVTFANDLGLGSK
jgi:regulator of sigma E protease